MRGIEVPSGLSVEEKEHGVVIVTIDRPSKANTIDTDMHSRLTSLWSDLSKLDTVRVVVLTGAGSVFCGGGDKHGWIDLIEDRKWRRRKMAEARAIIIDMLSCSLPLVAAVNGPAIGLGCSLAIACDVMIMSADSYLSDPHVATGLVAGDGGSALLPEVLPLPIARRLLLAGGQLTADEASAASLCTAVVSCDDLLGESMSVAIAIAQQPSRAVQDTKRAINAALLSRILPSLEYASSAEEASFDSPDFHDRVGYTESEGTTSARVPSGPTSSSSNT